MYKFSILTACYNNRQFLPDYFRSVLSQQYPDLEIIFVDDCSTDGSVEYAQSQNDPRLRVIVNTEKKYCSGTYAVALSQATGDICGIVDADDALVDNAVSIIVDAYCRYPDLGYIYTQHYWCDKNLKVLKKGVSGAPGGSLVHAVRARRHAFSHWRTFKRELSAKAEIFPKGLRYTVDKNMGFTLEELAPGGFLNECLYYYRYYPGNMSLTCAHQQRTVARSLVKTYAMRRDRTGHTVYPIRSIT